MAGAIFTTGGTETAGVGFISTTGLAGMDTGAGLVGILEIGAGDDTDPTGADTGALVIGGTILFSTGATGGFW